MILVEYVDCYTHMLQVFAVSEGYEKSYWAAALCNNVLVKGDMKYFNDFKKCLQPMLTPTLITEAVRRSVVVCYFFL